VETLKGVGKERQNLPDIPTQPCRRVCTITKFSDNLKTRIENLASSYGIELVMAIPRKALLLEELTGGIDLRA
jgi:hypothetical protein